MVAKHLLVAVGLASSIVLLRHNLAGMYEAHASDELVGSHGVPRVFSGLQTIPSTSQDQPGFQDSNLSWMLGPVNARLARAYHQFNGVTTGSPTRDFLLSVIDSRMQDVLEAAQCYEDVVEAQHMTPGLITQS